MTTELIFYSLIDALLQRRDKSTLSRLPVVVGGCFTAEAVTKLCKDKEMIDYI
jgi:hypothetical protein